MDSVTKFKTHFKAPHWTDHALACVGLFLFSLLVVLAADALSVDASQEVSVPTLLARHAMHVVALLFEKIWFYSALLLAGAFNSAIIVGGVQLLRHWDRRLSRAWQRRALRTKTQSAPVRGEILPNWLEGQSINRKGVDELVLKPLHQV